MRLLCKTHIFSILCFVFVFAAPVMTFASPTSGTITQTPAYAWGENTGWLNFATDESNVTVTDSGLTGYVWSAKFGWINLSPGGDFGGVTNDGEGNLGGYAWGSHLGPISFTGVIISDSGVFEGQSSNSGTTAGRISFTCDECSVTTDWRPVSVRNGITSDAGGSSSGRSGSRRVLPDQTSFLTEVTPTFLTSFLNYLTGPSGSQETVIQGSNGSGVTTSPATSTDEGVPVTQQPVQTTDIGSNDTDDGSRYPWYWPWILLIPPALFVLYRFMRM